MDMLKISLISYKSTILRVHRSVFFVFLRFPDQQIKRNSWHAQRHGIPNKVLCGESLPQEWTYYPFIYHIWLRRSPLSCPFHLKMVSLKNSLFFASRFECTAPLFFLFLNSMNRKKKQDIFSAFCFLILPFESFSQPFIIRLILKSTTPQHTWNLIYPFRAEPLAVYAITIEGYPGAQLG